MLNQQESFQNEQFTLNQCGRHYLKDADSQISRVRLLADAACF